MRKTALFLITVIAAAFVFLLVFNLETKINTQSNDNQYSTQKFNMKEIAGMPLHFENNIGQASADVNFISRGSGNTLLLKSNTAEWILPETKSNSKDSEKFIMEILNANPNPGVSGLNKMEGKSSYFFGNDKSKWITNVDNYSRIKYNQIYNGIDLVYYGNQKSLEFDFVVSPGANPDDIKFRFDKQSVISKSKKGEIEIKKSRNSLVLKKPFIYQEKNGKRVEIDGSFTLSVKDELGFTLSEYDKSLPVVIDPVITHLSHLGFGSYNMKMKISKSGEVFLCGDFSAPNPSAVFGDEDNGSISIVKFDPKQKGNDAFIFSTSIGGSESDIAGGFDFDKDGNIIIVGNTKSPDFPMKNAVKSEFSLLSMKLL